MIFLILGLLLGAIAVIFILQNVTYITVTFLVWQLHGSLALVLILAVLIGAVIAILGYLPEMIDNYMEISSLKRHIKGLEDEERSHKNSLDKLQEKLNDNTGPLI